MEAALDAIGILAEEVEVEAEVLMVDDAGEVPGVVRVVEVEALLDEYGVVVIAGEDDGLAEAVAALQAAQSLAFPSQGDALG